MQDILNRINKIQDEWNKPLECKGPELTEEEYKKIKNQIEIDNRKTKIKTRLKELTEDMIQYMYGEEVPNLQARKAEFIELHNELRVIEGKTPRPNNLDNRRI